MNSRLSYASSPESDLDLSPEPRPGASNAATAGGSKSPPSPSGRLVKSSSDPSIATQDDLGLSLNMSGNVGGQANGAAKFSPPPSYPVSSTHAPVSKLIM